MAVCKAGRLWHCQALGEASGTLEPCFLKLVSPESAELGNLIVLASIHPDLRIVPSRLVNIPAFNAVAVIMPQLRTLRDMVELPGAVAEWAPTVIRRLCKVALTLFSLSVSEFGANCVFVFVGCGELGCGGPRSR